MFLKIVILSFCLFSTGLSCILISESGNPIFRFFPNEPVVLQNHDFFLKIKNPRPIQSCTITIYDCWEYTPIMKNSTANKDGWTYWGNEEKGECGVIISSKVENPTGKYIFRITDDTKAPPSQKHVQVRLQKTRIPQNGRQASVEIGKSFPINCYLGENPQNVLYTRIYNPQNDIVYEGTSTTYYIKQAEKRDEGTWKCVYLLEESENEIISEIKLTVTQGTFIKSEKIETDTHLNLLWTVSQSFSDFRCFFERPDGTMISLWEGILYQRYAYYGQGKKSHECGISIPKPLRDEENGMWKIVIRNLKNSELFGGFVNVRAQAKSQEFPLDEVDLLPGTTRKSVEIVAGMDLTIQCNARASLTYCYLESPSGKIYNGWEFINGTIPLYKGLGMTLGDCKITVPGNLVNRSESGRWTCNMGVAGIYKDLQVSIDVTIRNDKFSAVTTEVEAKLKSSAVLSCRSLKGYALNYCRFNGPNRIGINLLNNNATIMGKYSYSGQGLDAGECGIKIDHIEKNDFGVWKCSASIAGVVEKNEYVDQISLKEEKGTGYFSTKIAIGLGFAVSFVTLSIMGLIFRSRRWKTRTTRK